MATSSATAPNFRSSPQRDNFIRLTRLLIAGGTPILRNVLEKYHTPQSLATNLASTRIRFTKPQKQLVSPPSDFEQFDISLIFKLLRNCCGELTEPVTKWNELPQEGDVSLEADIVRIDVYRNEIYGHTLENMALTDDEFEKYWENISGALLRLANSVSGQSTVTQLRPQILKLRDCFLTAQDREHIFMEYLRDIRSSLEQQDEKLENIEAKEDKITQGIEGLQDAMFHTASALHDLKISDKKTPTTAASPTVQCNTNIVNIFTSPDAQGTAPIARQVSEGSNEMPRNHNIFNKSFSLPCNVARLPEEPFPQFPSTGQTEKLSQEDVFQNLSHGEYRQETPKNRGNKDNVSFGDVGNRVGAFGCESANQNFFEPGRLTAATQGGNGASQKTPLSVNQSFSSSPRHQGPYTGLEEDDSLLRISISLPHVDLDDFHLGHVMRSLLGPIAEGSEIYQFYSYLEERRQLTIRNVGGNQNGRNCYIDVTPRDLTSLEDLWHDYIMNDLREFVKETILPEDFRGEVDVHIDGTQYARCCQSLRPREFKDSGKQLHSQSSSQVTDVSDIPTQETARMPRSKSMVQLPNAQQHAIEELFLVICKNGGRMKLKDAKNQPLYASAMEVDKPVFRQKMTEYFKLLPDSFIQAKVKLQFCPKKRKDSTCEDAKCPDLHLCSYHFLSRCDYSQDCKNSHDIRATVTQKMCSKWRIFHLSVLLSACN